MSFWRLRRLVVDAPQLRKQDCGRPLALADWPSAHAQHPVQDQRQKAYQRVRPNASGKPVVRRADLDLTLERPKTPVRCRPSSFNVAPPGDRLRVYPGNRAPNLGSEELRRCRSAQR